MEMTAQCHNLICHLTFGDQLEGIDNLLNNLPDQHTEVTLEATRDNIVEVWRICQTFIVITQDDMAFQGKDKEQDAKIAQADTVLEQQHRAQQEQEREAELKKAALQVNTNNDDVPCFVLQLQGQQAEILVDEGDWRDLTAREATLTVISRNSVPMVRIPGQPPVLLSRLLRPAWQNQVVDHINRNPWDNRRYNLRATNHWANAQNTIRPSTSGLIGVRQGGTGWWYLQFQTIDKQGPFTVTRSFGDAGRDQAVEMYDLVSLYQHGPGALLNHPERLTEYLEALGDDSRRQEVEALLTRRPLQQGSNYMGVSAVQGKWSGSITHLRQRMRFFEPVFDSQGEIRCAIWYNLWRLKFDSNLKVNFECLRPCYLHWAAELTKQNQRTFVDKAYWLLGRDAFAELPDKEQA